MRPLVGRFAMAGVWPDEIPLPMIDWLVRLAAGVV